MRSNRRVQRPPGEGLGNNIGRVTHGTRRGSFAAIGLCQPIIVGEFMAHETKLRKFWSLITGYNRPECRRGAVTALQSLVA